MNILKYEKLIKKLKTLIPKNPSKFELEYVYYNSTEKELAVSNLYFILVIKDINLGDKDLLIDPKIMNIIDGDFKYPNYKKILTMKATSYDASDAIDIFDLISNFSYFTKQCKRIYMDTTPKDFYKFKIKNAKAYCSNVYKAKFDLVLSKDEKYECELGVAYAF